MRNPSNAKIFFVLSIFNSIGRGEQLENRICFDERLKTNYIAECSKYSSAPITPIYKPFFHLSSSLYYHIRWVGDGVNSHARTPSAKYLRDYVNYAYFDDELWELLQDKGVREELTNALIDHFIKTV